MLYTFSTMLKNWNEYFNIIREIFTCAQTTQLSVIFLVRTGDFFKHLLVNFNPMIYFQQDKKLHFILKSIFKMLK